MTVVGGAAWLVRVLAVVMILLLPGRAAASSCGEVPFAKLAEGADVIFVGTAISIDGELATTFEVERVYKGEIPARIVVATGGVKYAMLLPPHRYLVLAQAGSPDAAPGTLHGHQCSGSKREPWAAEITAQLGDGWPAIGAAVAPNEGEPDQPDEPEPSSDAATSPTQGPPASALAGGCASCSIDHEALAHPWRFAGLCLLLCGAARPRLRARVDDVVVATFGSRRR